MLRISEVVLREVWRAHFLKGFHVTRSPGARAARPQPSYGRRPSRRSRPTGGAHLGEAVLRGAPISAKSSYGGRPSRRSRPTGGAHLGEAVLREAPISAKPSYGRRPSRRSRPTGGVEGEALHKTPQPSPATARPSRWRSEHRSRPFGSVVWSSAAEQPNHGELTNGVRAERRDQVTPPDGTGFC